MPTMSVSDLQKALKVAHAANPGTIPDPGTIDNSWGGHTQASYLAFADANPGLFADPNNVFQSTVLARANTINLDPGAYTALSIMLQTYQANPARFGGSVATVPRPAAPPPVAVLPEQQIVPDGAPGPEIWPWVLAGVGLLGVGGYFLWKGGHSARAQLATNRRRTSRRGRRRLRRYA